MEVLAQMLKAKFNSGLIGYHPNAAEVMISHLSFADDIMIFFDGTANSLQEIVTTLSDFSHLSGLCLNPGKSHLFMAGLSNQQAESLRSFNFQPGDLPMRYLGLPLMSRRLKLSEYSPLISKVANRFNDWACKSLSFAGRLQLIKSVIYGTMNFWFSAFLLPKGCIRRLESLCSKFLWSGCIDKKHHAKVSWKSVCLPKTEGGLGLRDLTTWNKCLALKLIWLLFANGGSLWVAWNSFYRLNRISFWVIEEKQRDSWIWKVLLHLRPLEKQFITCSIGDGNRISFWHDNWTSLGTLSTFFGETGPSQLGIPTTATISHAISSTGWNFRSARSDQAVSLLAYLSTKPLPTAGTTDTYSFTLNGKSYDSFKTSILWDFMRPRDQVKHWHSQIWFKGSTPRQSFTMWAATLDRLPTRTRLLSWGMIISPNCCICSDFEETREHIFLRCQYGSNLWTLALRRMRINPVIFYTWNALIHWTSRSTSTAPSLLRKIVAHAIIYNIWAERNSRFHTQKAIPSDILFKRIDRQVRDTILSKQHIFCFTKLMVLWLPT